VFYATTALLSFGSFCVVGGCTFGPVTNGFWAVSWPLVLLAFPSEMVLGLLGGLAIATIEPRVTGVGR